MIDFAAESKARLEAQVAQLQEFLVREDEHLTMLVEATAASQDRKRRIERAIGALQGATKGQKVVAGPKSKPPGKPSPPTISTVLALLGEHGPMSIPAMNERINGKRNPPSDRFRRAIYELRQQGKVRLAGVEEDSNAPQKAKVWALMPTGDMRQEGTDPANERAIVS